MDTARTTLRTLTAARRAPRLLAALALAAALVALPAVRPENAGAQYDFEKAVSEICYRSGGSMEYDFWDPNYLVWTMQCTVPGGTSFTCMSDAHIAVGIVDCY